MNPGSQDYEITLKNLNTTPKTRNFIYSFWVQSSLKFSCHGILVSWKLANFSVFICKGAKLFNNHIQLLAKGSGLKILLTEIVLLQIFKSMNTKKRKTLKELKK